MTATRNGRKKKNIQTQIVLAQGDIMKYTKIKSVDHLKEVLSKDEEGKDFILQLNFGLRSSKRMTWDGEKFWILHYIDDTQEELTPKQLMKHTNIYEGIKKGAFWLEENI